ncbi:MAG: hypothetical protein MHPSP_001264, partial [Paramarteilia canceri]
MVVANSNLLISALNALRDEHNLGKYEILMKWKKLYKRTLTLSAVCRSKDISDDICQIRKIFAELSEKTGTCNNAVNEELITKDIQIISDQTKEMVDFIEIDWLNFYSNSANEFQTVSTSNKFLIQDMNANFDHTNKKESAQGQDNEELEILMLTQSILQVSI